MSVGLRDQLVQIFSYTPTTAAGRTQDAYTLLGERWARAEFPAGFKTYLVGKEQQRVDGTFAFGDDATDIDQKGILRVKGQTQVWKILALPPARRRVREIHVLVAAASAQQYPGLP